MRSHCILSLIITGSGRIEDRYVLFIIGRWGGEDERGRRGTQRRSVCRLCTWAVKLVPIITQRASPGSDAMQTGWQQTGMRRGPEKEDGTAGKWPWSACRTAPSDAGHVAGRDGGTHRKTRDGRKQQRVRRATAAVHGPSGIPRLTVLQGVGKLKTDSDRESERAWGRHG